MRAVQDRTPQLDLLYREVHAQGIDISYPIVSDEPGEIAVQRGRVPVQTLPATELLDSAERRILEIAEKPLSLLSKGQAYKALLAAYLVVAPELWILDEPFASGMDPSGFNVFKRRARDAAARGATVIYSTQILEVAERFADDVCVLHRGSIRFSGPVAQLGSASADGTLSALFDQLKESVST